MFWFLSLVLIRRWLDEEGSPSIFYQNELQHVLIATIVTAVI